MIPVATIVKSLMGRAQQAQLAALDGLLASERERVRTALAALPPGTSVDLGKLIEKVRRQTEHEAQLRPAPEPWRYFVSIASLGQLKVMRDELRRTGDIVAAMTAAQRTKTSASISPLELAVEPDDEGKLRPCRRVSSASRRAAQIPAN